MSALQDTYKLAHTAQCKLGLAADRPDRNLRFLLGHAFTLDAVTIRILQIEEEDPGSLPQEKSSRPVPTGRHVSFSAPSTRPSGEERGEPTADRKRPVSPPPEPELVHTGEDSEPDEEDEENDNELEDESEEFSAPLTRFVSASAMPPRTKHDIEKNSSTYLEQGEASISLPTMLDSEYLREMMSDKGDGRLTDLYESIRSCGCQRNVSGSEVPVPSKIWEVPGSMTTQQSIPRLAVMRV